MSGIYTEDVQFDEHCREPKPTRSQNRGTFAFLFDG
jgi:hypothetical protein